MTWSYSFDPDSSPKDNVRFLLGDTDERDKLLHDEEIGFLLKQAGGRVFSAAASGCEVVMAKLSRAVDESVGSVSISFSQRLGAYEKLLSTLRRRQALNGGLRPFSGGIDRGERQMWECDRSKTPPQFRVREGCSETSFGWGRAYDGQVYDADGDCYGGDGICDREIAAGVTDRGDQIYSGPNDPTAATPGQTGDYYFNTTTKTLFGPHV